MYKRISNKIQCWPWAHYTKTKHLFKGILPTHLKDVSDIEGTIRKNYLISGKLLSPTLILSLCWSCMSSVMLSQFFARRFQAVCLCSSRLRLIRKKHKNNTIITKNKYEMKHSHMVSLLSVDMGLHCKWDRSRPLPPSTITLKTNFD